MRPLNQTTKPVHQTDRPPDDYRHDSRPDLRSDHQTQSPNYQSIRSGHHLHARPTKPMHQTTILDYSASNQHSTPNFLKLYRSGAFFVGWVKGGIYRALDEPCKAYFPHTFGPKFLDFLFERLNLTVVRLVSGVTRVGKGLPFPFS